MFSKFKILLLVAIVGLHHVNTAHSQGSIPETDGTKVTVTQFTPVHNYSGCQIQPNITFKIENFDFIHHGASVKRFQATLTIYRHNADATTEVTNPDGTVTTQLGVWEVFREYTSNEVLLGDGDDAVLSAGVGPNMQAIMPNDEYIIRGRLKMYEPGPFGNLLAADLKKTWQTGIRWFTKTQCQTNTTDPPTDVNSFWHDVE